MKSNESTNIVKIATIDRRRHSCIRRTPFSQDDPHRPPVTVIIHLIDSRRRPSNLDTADKIEPLHPDTVTLLLLICT